MDHVTAQATKACERYLLGELDEPERFEFEDHYFQCRDCAEEVRLGSTFKSAIRAVGREDAMARPRPVDTRPPERAGSRLWKWLTPAALVPSAAAAMLACVVGYQSLVLIPRLNQPEAVETLVLRAAARGDEQTVENNGPGSSTLLRLDVNETEPGTPLTYEIGPADQPTLMKGAAKAPPPGLPLFIRVPRSKLDRAGQWNLILRSASGSEIARYPFQLK